MADNKSIYSELIDSNTKIFKENNCRLSYKLLHCKQNRFSDREITYTHECKLDNSTYIPTLKQLRKNDEFKQKYGNKDVEILSHKDVVNLRIKLDNLQREDIAEYLLDEQTWNMFHTSLELQTRCCVGKLLFFGFHEHLEYHTLYDDEDNYAFYFDKKSGEKDFLSHNGYAIDSKKMSSDIYEFHDVVDIIGHFGGMIINVVKNMSLNKALDISNLYLNTGVYDYSYERNIRYFSRENIEEEYDHCKNVYDLNALRKKYSLPCYSTKIIKHERDKEHFIGTCQFVFDFDLKTVQYGSYEHINNDKKRREGKDLLLEDILALENYGINFGVINESRNGFQSLIVFREFYITNEKFMSKTKAFAGNFSNVRYIPYAIFNLLFMAGGRAMSRLLPCDMTGCNSLMRLYRFPLSFHLKDDSNAFEMGRVVQAKHYRDDRRYGFTIEEYCEKMQKLCHEQNDRLGEIIFNSYLNGTLDEEKSEKYSKIYSYEMSGEENHMISSNLARHFIEAYHGDEQAKKELKQYLVIKEMNENISIDKLLKKDKVGDFMLNSDSYLNALHRKDMKRNRRKAINPPQEIDSERQKHSSFWNKNRECNIIKLLAQQGVSRYCICKVLNDIGIHKEISFYYGRIKGKCIKKIIKNWKEVMQFCRKQSYHYKRIYMQFLVILELHFEAMISCISSRREGYFRNGFVCYNPSIIQDIINRRFSGTKRKFVTNKYFARYSFLLMKGLGFIRINFLSSEQFNLPKNHGFKNGYTVVRPLTIHINDLKKKLIELASCKNYSISNNLFTMNFSNVKLKKYYGKLGEKIANEMHYDYPSLLEGQQMIANKATRLACNPQQYCNMTAANYAFINSMRSILFSYYKKNKMDIIKNPSLLKSKEKELDDLFNKMFDEFDKYLTRHRNCANGMYFKSKHVIDRNLCLRYYITMKNNLFRIFDDRDSKNEELTYQNGTTESSYYDKYYFTINVQILANNFLTNYFSTGFINVSLMIDIFQTPRSIYHYFRLNFNDFEARKQIRQYYLKRHCDIIEKAEKFIAA